MIKPYQVDWQKLVITEILFCYRKIELINIHVKLCQAVWIPRIDAYVPPCQGISQKGMLLNLNFK